MAHATSPVGKKASEAGKKPTQRTNVTTVVNERAGLMFAKQAFHEHQLRPSVRWYAVRRDVIKSVDYRMNTRKR